MSKFDLGSIQTQGACGMDALFETSPELIRPIARRRIASLQELAGFVRVSEDTLVHKSEQDLWSMRRDGEAFVIERLFDSGSGPVKG